MKKFDAIIVGAGFAGMYMLHRLRQQGMEVRLFEAGADVGGTWYWNRYPGARCDIESMEYSYQFDQDLQQEWVWTERYSTQPEILSYAHHVADRFGLREDIQFNTRVEAMNFCESSDSWQVSTDKGEAFSAGFVIAATGCLSIPNEPVVPGQESFLGDVYHTGRWPHQSVDFTGKRVAVIGTGSSGIQSIPEIAAQAAELYVFQRSPAYSVPARNRPLDSGLQRDIKSRYAEFREMNKQRIVGFGADHPGNEGLTFEMSPQEREQQFEKHWQLGGLLFSGAFGDTFVDPVANRAAADFVRKKIRQTVQDPAVAEKLCPDSTIFCKRLCADTHYFDTFNQPHVQLVDLKATPIEEITPQGVRTTDTDFELDCIVFATGFDAMTGALNKIDIRGRGGQSLREKWVDGPRTYLGLETAGFPNLFMVTGPGSPSVLTNMLPTIEQHVDFIADCIEYLRKNGLNTVEADTEAENQWVDYVSQVAESTLLTSCNSWYLGSNIPDKPRVFLALLGFPDYIAKCKEIVANDYEGFVLR